MKGEIRNPPLTLATLYERFNAVALESKMTDSENFLTINLPFQVSCLTYDYLFSSFVKGFFYYDWLDVVYWKGYYDEIPKIKEFEECRYLLRKLVLFASNITKNTNFG